MSHANYAGLESKLGFVFIISLFLRLQHVLVNFPVLPCRLVVSVWSRTTNEAIPVSLNVYDRLDCLDLRVERFAEACLHMPRLEELGMCPPHRLQGTFANFID
jgi:hypothetical protein